MSENDYSCNTLDLSSSHLTALPDDIHEYTNLKVLKCNMGNLTSIQNLPDSLEYLSCYGNKLKKLDNLPPI